MHELLERLGRGDTKILEMCQRANQAWRDFLTELESADTGTLSARLGFFQRDMEKIFESKALAHNMMPWMGFSSMHNSSSGWGGNEKRAIELVQAFAASNCSAEVRSEARAAAISYELDKSPGFARTGTG
jgi:hypothetical protein